MRRHLVLSAAAAALLAASGAAFAQSNVTATTDLNVRAGPGPHHPVVDVLGAGQSATLNGCLENSKWCVVAVNGKRRLGLFGLSHRRVRRPAGGHLTERPAEFRHCRRAASGD